MAIVFGDEETVQWLLEHGASLKVLSFFLAWARETNFLFAHSSYKVLPTSSRVLLQDEAKAYGAFFMPRVVRRGHLDEERTWWREWKTEKNLQSDDDVVGVFNPLSAHAGIWNPPLCCDSSASKGDIEIFNCATLVGFADRLCLHLQTVISTSASTPSPSRFRRGTAVCAKQFKNT